MVAQAYADDSFMSNNMGKDFLQLMHALSL